MTLRMDRKKGLPPSIHFGGHYTLGERIQPVDSITIRAAHNDAQQQERKGIVGILVGDIDFHQKIAAYIKRGIEGVKDSYRKRVERNPTGCVRSQLPTTEQELGSIVDEEQYIFAVRKLQELEPSLHHALVARELDTQDTAREGLNRKLAEVTSSHIIPALGRLQMYGDAIGIPPFEAAIYSERELKNIVAQRIRPSRKQSPNSWRKIVDTLQSPITKTLFCEVQSAQGIPVCRGILLALYEQLAKEGYTHTVQHYSTRQQLAIQNATDLYNALHKEFPNDPRWNLNITNKFYQEQEPQQSRGGTTP